MTNPDIVVNSIILKYEVFMDVGRSVGSFIGTAFKVLLVVIALLVGALTAVVVLF